MYSDNVVRRLIEKKKEFKYTNAQISAKSGVPISTVNKILGGHSKYPRQENVEAIATSLGLELMDYTTRSRGTTYFVRETPQPYFAPGQKTVEDYCNMPEDFRGELILGEIIELKAPTVNHQLILSELSFLITAYLREIGSTCQGFPAPFDVQLFEDEYTMVQPDYVVICDKSKYINGKNCYGCPDLVIEITSPSNSDFDMMMRLYMYRIAGVKEYWEINPMTGKVTTHSMFPCKGPKSSMYEFDDVVSSKLFEGLSIDFSEIKKKLV